MSAKLTRRQAILGSAVGAVSAALNRQNFLRFVAASPLAAAARAPSEQTIASAAEALNVFDFDAAARQRRPPAHYGYIATGVDGDRTMRANREGFERFQIRSRRLVGRPDPGNESRDVAALRETGSALLHRLS